MSFLSQFLKLTQNINAILKIIFILLCVQNNTIKDNFSCEK